MEILQKGVEMPVPLIPLVSVVASSLGGLLKVATYAAIVNYLTDNGVVRAIESWIVQAALERAGLHLSEDDPLSDASLSSAVSERFGIAIRTLKDKNSIREDVETWAADQVSARTGYVVRSFSNGDMLKEDMTRIAAAVLTERTGMPLGVIMEDGFVFKAEDIKERVLSWAKAELMNTIEGEVRMRVEEMMTMPDVEALAMHLNSQLERVDAKTGLSVRRVALNMANNMAMKAILSYQKVTGGMDKKARRREQNRLAQQRFRQARPGRTQYVPLEWQAVFYNYPGQVMPPSRIG